MPASLNVLLYSRLIHSRQKYLLPRSGSLTISSYYLHGPRAILLRFKSLLFEKALLIRSKLYTAVLLLRSVKNHNTSVVYIGSQ